jgi:hypothetical protein
VGAINNLGSIFSKDLERHHMANVFGDANKETASFTGVGRKATVVKLVVDRFVE